MNTQESKRLSEIDLKKIIASDHFHLLRNEDESIDEYEAKRMQYLDEIKSAGLEPIKSIGDCLHEASQKEIQPVVIPF